MRDSLRFDSFAANGISCLAVHFTFPPSGSHHCQPPCTCEEGVSGFGGKKKRFTLRD